MNWRQREDPQFTVTANCSPTNMRWTLKVCKAPATEFLGDER